MGIWAERFNSVYGGTKAFALAFTQSLQHELGQKGRIQAVLPGTTATEFWDAAGLPVHHSPRAVIISPEDTVGAAHVGLDQGEIVTIPGLYYKTKWDRFDTAHRADGEAC